MKDYVAFKGNVLLLFQTQVEVQNIMLSEIRWPQKVKYPKICRGKGWVIVVPHQPDNAFFTCPGLTWHIQQELQSPMLVVLRPCRTLQQCSRGVALGNPSSSLLFPSPRMRVLPEEWGEFPQLLSFHVKSQALEIHLWKAFQGISQQGVSKSADFSKDLF
jgi:hypothetical protein